MVDSRGNLLLRYVRGLLDERAAAAETDGQLLERFLQNGEESAFVVLMRRHGPRIWSVCRRLLPTEQDAEDVFQATFLVFARQAHTIRRRASLGSWLYGVAQRLALRVRGENARCLAHPAPAPKVTVADAADDVLWRELRTALDGSRPPYSPPAGGSQ